MNSKKVTTIVIAENINADLNIPGDFTLLVFNTANITKAIYPKIVDVK